MKQFFAALSALAQNVRCRLGHRNHWKRENTTINGFVRYWCRRCNITIYRRINGNTPAQDR